MSFGRGFSPSLTPTTHLSPQVGQKSIGGECSMGSFFGCGPGVSGITFPVCMGTTAQSIATFSAGASEACSSRSGLCSLGNATNSGK